MKKFLILGVVAAASVGMAVVLFVLMAPDTGETVADADRAKVGTVPVAERKEGTLHRPDGRTPTKVEPHPAPEGGAPVEALHERQKAPDAVFAGRAQAPWSLIRRQLLKKDDEAAATIRDGSAKIIADLRQMRRNPDTVDFAELEERQQELLKVLRESEHIKDPQISKSVERVDAMFEQFHEAQQ